MRSGMRRVENRAGDRMKPETVETIAAWLAIPVLTILTILCFAL